MNRSRRLVLGTVVLALALSACSSSSKSGSSTTTPTSPGGSAKLSGTITLAVNPWDGSAANAAVAKAVLEKQGVTVNTKDIDENAAWPALDSDSIDANLEVWPSGHQKDIQTYITDKKSVVDGGLIGPTGHIGWYIPKFVADAHPEFKTWQGLKSQAAADYFKTAETGDKGQFLLGDPSYVSYDADDHQEPEPAVQGRRRWRRGRAHHHDREPRSRTRRRCSSTSTHRSGPTTSTRSSSVKLPPVTPACTAAASSPSTYSKYNCDYPTDHLMKAISAKLETKNPGVFKFLEKMKWTDKDQNTVTGYKNVNGMTIDQAAQKWVNDNPTVWQAWLN